MRNFKAKFKHMELANLESHFVDIGGQFCKSSYDIREQLKDIKAYVFDWDGVFNSGFKNDASGSGFSEIDAVGIRLLRLGHFLKFGTMPAIGIITGADNPAAKWMMQRLNGDFLYQRALNKTQALADIEQQSGIKPEEICFVFDDAPDLNIAREVGLRFGVGRMANPLFLEYLLENNLVDYITSAQGNEHAVRETCELLLGLLGNYTEVLENISVRSLDYLNYRSEVQKIALKSYRWDGESFQVH